MSEGKASLWKEEASYKRWVSLETMCSSFPLKLGREDEVKREITIGKMRVCGFMIKAREQG